MILKIPNIFKPEGLTDNEKLFLWFLGKMWNRYGFEQGITLDGYDFKILLNNNPLSHVTQGAVSDNLKEYLRFAFYSDRRIGVEIKPELLKELSRTRTLKGKIMISKHEVTITSHTTIAIYCYLLGILGYMHNWSSNDTQRTKVGHSSADLYLSNTEAMKDGRLTEFFELNQLLKAFEPVE